MDAARKQIFDSFQEHLYHEYVRYCHHQLRTPSLPGLITYLIDRDLLSKKIIKKYTIQKEFQNLYPVFKHHKTKTVLALADRFNISERSVWSSIKNQGPTIEIQQSSL